MRERRLVLGLGVVALALLVFAFAAGCIFMTPGTVVHAQFGGHANAAANTGEAGLQRQAGPDMPAGEVDAGYGLGYIKAKQGATSQPTTQPTKPNQ